MSVIKITRDEYIKTYNDLKAMISLHSCWTNSEENSQLTKWCLNNGDDWFLSFSTTNGEHEYFKQCLSITVSR